MSWDRAVKGEDKKRKSAEARVWASARGSAHVHARSGGAGAGGRGRGNEAEDGAEQMGGGAQTRAQTKTTKREAISKSPQVSA